MKTIRSGTGKLIQPIEIEEFREWNRNKPKGLIDKRMTEKEAVEKFVFKDAYLGIELYGTVRCPMSIVHEIIRQGISNLRVAGQGVLELDLLLGAGLIKALDLTYSGLELYGISHCLRREVESGRIGTVVEWSNAALSWRFKAAAMGVPFIPVRSMLGSDTLKYSAAKVVECPFTGKPLCLLPALILDVGIIHVHRADQYGNAQIDGIAGFAFEMARASKRLIISTEKIVDHSMIREKPDRTIIPYYIVDAVVEASYGSHPGEMYYLYNRDEMQIREWVKASKQPNTTSAYLDKYIFNHNNHHDYLQMIGWDHLKSLKKVKKK